MTSKGEITPFIMAILYIFLKNDFCQLSKKDY